MKKFPVPLWIRLPSVPEQQVMVFPLVAESLTLPPLVPNCTGGVSLEELFTTTALPLPVTLELDCEVAVMATDLPESNGLGAVYSPPALIVPVALLPPATPFTLQLTVGGVPVAAVAVNCAVPPKGTTAGFAQPVPVCAHTVSAPPLGVGVGVGGPEVDLEPPQPITVPSKASAQNGLSILLYPTLVLLKKLLTL